MPALENRAGDSSWQRVGQSKVSDHHPLTRVPRSSHVFWVFFNFFSRAAYFTCQVE